MDDLYEPGLPRFSMISVVLENLYTALWIISGTLLTWKYSPLIAKIYLVFNLLNILVIMRILVCRNCYYHGKVCHNGWGILSGMLCRKGDVKKFADSFGFKMVPFFYSGIAIVPLFFLVLAGIDDFDMTQILYGVAHLYITICLIFGPRKHACAHCKMRKICPGSAAKPIVREEKEE